MNRIVCFDPIAQFLDILRRPLYTACRLTDCTGTDLAGMVRSCLGNPIMIFSHLAPPRFVGE
jgi:hypothetical protein